MFDFPVFLCIAVKWYGPRFLKQKHMRTLPICIWGHETLKVFKGEIVPIRCEGVAAVWLHHFGIRAGEGKKISYEKDVLLMKIYDTKGMKVATIE